MREFCEYLRFVPIPFLSILILSCGVKSPPTPVLSTPPSQLQQEADKRVLEKREKEKSKSLKTEKSKP
jgi:hypothetical protein